MRKPIDSMTARQIGFAMMDIALTAQTMERVVMILNGGELEDDRDKQAMLDVLSSLTQKVGCLSDSVSEQIGTTMLRGPRAWHLDAVLADDSAAAATSP